VDQADGLQALAHPVRLEILDALRRPGSAADAARACGIPRQNANQHLKTLERAGLIEKIDEGPTGNFVSSIYRTVAPTIVVSPRAVWADDRRLDAMRDQVSLENLVAVGERLGHDAAVLLDRATFDGESIASAAVEADVSFPDEASRTAFMREYLALVGPLLDKYGSGDGRPYKVSLTAYPDPEVHNSDNPHTGPDTEGAEP
jgi:DNA-binding transcriptional ArsR family regulator